MSSRFRVLVLVLVAAGALVLPMAEQLDMQQLCEASDVEDGEELEDDFTAVSLLLTVGPTVAIERPEPAWSCDGGGERDANATRLERPPRQA